MSDEARDLIRQMLTLRPEHRISLRGIRQHAWLAPQAAGVLSQPVAPPTLGGDDDGRPLDAAVLARMESMGFEASSVERSVCGLLYNHENACYRMLVAAAANTRRAWDAEAAAKVARAP